MHQGTGKTLKICHPKYFIVILARLEAYNTEKYGLLEYYFRFYHILGQIRFIFTHKVFRNSY